MDRNWPRWIFASASKYFSDLIVPTCPLFIEGASRDPTVQKDFIEFRLDGPYVNEASKNCFYIDCEINLLVHCYKNDSDLHKIYRLCGAALAAFTPAFPVYKYGNGDADDQSILECMQLVRSNDQREAVRVSHFGQLDPSKKLMQSSVEGHYKMLLHG